MLLSGDVGSVLPLLGFTAWALLPYAVLLAAARRVERPWALAGAGAVAVATELGIRLAVFVFPRGSTAALALIFSPVFILAVMPVGGLAGHLIGRTFRDAGRALGMLALTCGVVALGLLTLGLARPDLFPTTVAARRAAVARIGPPGIRTGADTFESVLISNASTWRLTGEFDGTPGDELALVDRDGVRLIDPSTLVERDRLSLGGDSARWNWFSMLARVGGRLVRVDTGGGYQDTLVRALDGTLLWQYRPDPMLAPTALRPADLDNDGETEFYATSRDRLVRLDGDGRLIWQRALIGASIVAIEPPHAREPGWILTNNGLASVGIWTGAGVRLGEVRTGGDGYRPTLAVVDWQGRRQLVIGGERLTLVGLDGTTTLERRVPDMSVAAAAAVRFSPNAPALLAIVAAASRETRRARLQIVNEEQTVVYEEVTETMPRILTARSAGGAVVLLRALDQLHAIRLRPTSADGAP